MKLIAALIAVLITTTAHAAQPCNGSLTRQPPRQGTPYDFELELIQVPCVLSANPTLADAKLVWAQAAHTLTLMDANQPVSLGIHNAHDQAKAAAWSQSIVALNLLNQWEETGRQPRDWRQSQETFASMVERANTGPGRVVKDGGRWRLAWEQ